MPRVKMHFAIEWDSQFAHHTGTLCGRQSGETAECNCEEAAAHVTCKMCLQILNDPKHWRHRKYLKTTQRQDNKGQLPQKSKDRTDHKRS